jgi:magnesium chelatase family protein
VHGARTLLDVCAHLTGDAPIQPAHCNVAELWAGGITTWWTFADVRGQAAAKRALEVAAGRVAQHLADWSAGFGEDDAGSASPHHSTAMTLDEALETTRIHSVADCSPVDARSAPRVPFARLITPSVMRVDRWRLQSAAGRR